MWFFSLCPVAAYLYIALVLQDARKRERTENCFVDINGIETMFYDMQMGEIRDVPHGFHL